MAELKTQQNDRSVTEFLLEIEDEKRREDCLALLELMKEVTGAEPRMWGSSIVGLGSYHYKYAGGRENDWFLVGFSPRKQNLTLYTSYDIGHQGELLQKLGKHKIGKSCLYINKLEDIDLPTLKQLLERTIAYLTEAG